MMESGAKMVMDAERLAGGELPSFTCTPKLNVPATLGLPPRLPPDESVSPAGREPDDNTHVYGPPVPPVAAKPTEYAVPANPFGSVPEVVMDNVAPTFSERVWVAVLMPSDTFAVKENGPGTVAVPLKAPPPPRLIPAGSAPPETLQV